MGRVVGKSYVRQPVNLGTWEPDVFGYICLQYGAKADSEVKSHLRYKFSIIYMRNGQYLYKI